MKKLYNVFYVNNDQGGFEDFKTYETTTDNFDKWLAEHNAQRKEEGHRIEDADEFSVEPVRMFLYEDKIKKILENNGYIVEVEYENEQN
jgi:hypothetical protein